MFLMRWECAAMASRVYDKNTRLVEGVRHGKPGLPFGRRADWPGHKASAAVRTDVEKHVINAVRTERALV